MKTKTSTKTPIRNTLLALTASTCILVVVPSITYGNDFSDPFFDNDGSNVKHDHTYERHFQNGFTTPSPHHHQTPGLYQPFPHPYAPPSTITPRFIFDPVEQRIRQVY